MQTKIKINQTGLDEVIKKSEELVELSKRVQQLRREINAIDVIFDIDDGPEEEKEEIDISNLKVKNPVSADSDEPLIVLGEQEEKVNEELAMTIIALCVEIRKSVDIREAHDISALASALYNIADLYKR